MRSNAAEYDLVAPATLQDVLSALAEQPGTHTLLAGGTELMVALGAGRLKQTSFLSLHAVQELRFLQADEHILRIGAGTTFTDLRRSALIAQWCPLLTQTASWTGTIANQNRGTLGGNIANASPAADNPPALLAYDAQLELLSTRGSRVMPYAEFHLGYKRTVLAADELLFAIHIPLQSAGNVSWVRKVGTRNALAISKVALAIHANIHNRHIHWIRIGAASLADRPIRLFQTERLLQGQTIQNDLITQARISLAAESSPIDDIRSTANYRIAVAQNLLEEFLRSQR